MLWKWIGTNKLTAGIIAVLCLVALASATWAVQLRNQVVAVQMQAEQALKDQAAAKAKELQEATDTWQGKLEAADKKLAPVLRERDSLKVRLAALKAQMEKPFAVPITDDETISRWQALGYAVRVTPCK